MQLAQFGLLRLGHRLLGLFDLINPKTAGYVKAP